MDAAGVCAVGLRAYVLGWNMGYSKGGAAGAAGTADVHPLSRPMLAGSVPCGLDPRKCIDQYEVDLVLVSL